MDSPTLERRILDAPAACVVSLAALLVLSPRGSPRAQVPGSDEPVDLIYYDFLEGGVLKGGRIPVDTTDPLQAYYPAGTEGSSDVTTLLQNGPSSNRIDLVLVGDGYTAAELGLYATHVDAVLPVFLGEFPLSAYSTYFNVHRVDVLSNESGVDHDPVFGIYRDTALDMGFWCAGIERLLCVDVGKAYAQATNAPGVDQILAFANSSMYGGAGYPSSNLCTLAAANLAAIEIALHEFGHTLPDLADEYDYGDGATYMGAEPTAANVSTFPSSTMAALAAKWNLWLTEPNVETFEGAMYHQFGIYRPTLNSKMRSLGQPFEEVNAERFIVSLYATVDPIDDATPPGVYGADAVLAVLPLQPVTHDLAVQWFLDGAPIAGAVANDLDVSTLALSPGQYALSVQVVDTTAWVRDEASRAEYMTAIREWTILVPAPTGCGSSPPVLGIGGAPRLGTPLTISVANATGIPVIAFGFPGSFPLCPGQGGCVLGTYPLLGAIPGATLSLQVPNNAALVGGTLAFQGLDFGPNAGGCQPPIGAAPFDASDTLLLTVVE